MNTFLGQAKQHTAGREDAAVREDAAEVSTTKLITLAAAGKPPTRTVQQTGFSPGLPNSTAHGHNYNQREDVEHNDTDRNRLIARGSDFSGSLVSAAVVPTAQSLRKRKPLSGIRQRSHLTFREPAAIIPQMRE